MRFAFALVALVALVACAPSLQTIPDVDVPAGADAPPRADVAVAVDAPALLDVAAPVDVVAVDAPALDAGSPVDAPAAVDAPRDAGSVQDVNPRSSEVCRGVTLECNGRVVNVQTGERDGGLTYFCGSCTTTCNTAAGEFCVNCVCER